MYHIVTGSTPYSGERPMQILQQHIDPGIQPKPIKELRENVPRELIEMITCMMAQYPSQRYQSPQDILDAIPPEQIGNSLSYDWGKKNAADTADTRIVSQIEMDEAAENAFKAAQPDEPQESVTKVIGFLEDEGDNEGGVYKRIQETLIAVVDNINRFLGFEKKDGIFVPRENYTIPPKFQEYKPIDLQLRGSQTVPGFLQTYIRSLCLPQDSWTEGDQLHWDAVSLDRGLRVALKNKPEFYTREAREKLINEVNEYQLKDGSPIPPYFIEAIRNAENLGGLDLAHLIRNHEVEQSKEKDHELQPLPMLIFTAYGTGPLGEDEPGDLETWAEYLTELAFLDTHFEKGDKAARLVEKNFATARKRVYDADIAELANHDLELNANSSEGQEQEVISSMYLFSRRVSNFLLKTSPGNERG
tara:strand:+ start:35 stop:1285 length:1251 start_codon:yes stop_codon:yes gene_type:complete